MRGEQYKVELDLYHECLYDIRQRIDLINAHIHIVLSSEADSGDFLMHYYLENKTGHEIMFSMVVFMSLQKN